MNTIFIVVIHMFEEGETYQRMAFNIYIQQKKHYGKESSHFIPEKSEEIRPVLSMERKANNNEKWHHWQLMIFLNCLFLGMFLFAFAHSTYTPILFFSLYLISDPHHGNSSRQTNEYRSSNACTLLKCHFLYS